MPKLNIESIDLRVKWLVLLVSLMTIGFLVAAAHRENVAAEWRRTRLAYADILADKAVDDRGRSIAQQFEIRIMQNVLPDLQRTDRCITCHTGVDDPRMADQEQPFATHPGDYLSVHPPAAFGCTVCHEGQGLATEKADAHGEAPFWDYPLLAKKYMSTTCTRCHSRSDLEGDEGTIERMQRTVAHVGVSAAALMRLGKGLVESKGCLGCHTLDGKGGSLGPDITFVGEKTHHEFDFSHLGKDAPREVEYWLEQHFLDPSTISPDTVMPAAAVSGVEAKALTAYMLSLRAGAPSTFERPPEQVAAVAKDGRELYGMYCAACHGAEGRSDDVPQIRTPSLNNVDTLASADDDYLRAIIQHGRGGTKMPSWGEGAGGLSRDEIDRIVAYIRAWEEEGASPEDVSASRGDVSRGHAYYAGLCANCHGHQGEGGIGNALNAPAFLAIATDDFLARTIISGRPGTAMASWKELSSQAVSDMLAYMNAWRAEPPARDDVLAELRVESAAGLAAAGRKVYQGNCAACHGREGEGGIGVSLNTPDLLGLADDTYLYRAIVEGRPSTAMPAWRHLSARHVASLIAHMRSWHDGPAIATETPRAKGDYEVGRVLYDISCVRCHGADARGGSGPQLANPALLSSASDEMLYHWIARGRTGTAMKGFLSAEQGVTQLRPGQIMDIIAYLRHAGSATVRPILRTGVGDAHVGAEIFRGNCASCHGPHGEGGSGPQLNNPVFLRAASDGFLAATMVLGRPPTPMRSMVHGQEGLGQVAPSQVADVIAFLRRWEYPVSWRRPRAVAEVTHRAIMSGGQKFGAFCAGCHGPNGLGEREGVDYFAPSLNNPDFLRAAPDGFLLATIARGRRGTPMRPFGRGTGGIAELDGNAISDIVSYIRAWEAMPESERRALIPVEEEEIEEW